MVLPQQIDGQHLEAVIQVFTAFVLFYHPAQVAVRANVLLLPLPDDARQAAVEGDLSTRTAVIPCSSDEWNISIMKYFGMNFIV